MGLQKASTVSAQLNVRSLAGVGWDLAMKHCEDELPVSLRRHFVENIAVGKRVAVQRALVDLMRILDRARFQQLAELLNHRGRRELVDFGESAIDFAAHFRDAEMR